MDKNKVCTGNVKFGFRNTCSICCMRRRSELGVVYRNIPGKTFYICGECLNKVAIFFAEKDAVCYMCGENKVPFILKSAYTENEAVYIYICKECALDFNYHDHSSGLIPDPRTYDTD